ncbi:hypothetical protein [Nitrosopumilus sp.]|uniref:hypothetical protein n=1 Tax=Nitrosopumilus sp. TaxID=2024843 RepID=UPI0029317134|nr:hypothetical protein [Nitrosopumilus sp.]
MRHVELVAFENDSILHQKALSLPTGKVSLRQLGVLVVGILSVFAAYAITDNFWVAAIIFAVFLGIGMPNTKIITPDQMIKSVILFLIRGTSLSKKSEYLQKNSKQDHKKKEDDKKIRSVETQTNNNVMSKILSQIESLYKKKSLESKSSENLSNENKNYSIKIQLTPENMLNIVPMKTKQDKNSIDNLFNSLTTSKKNLSDLNNFDNFLQGHVSIMLDEKKIKNDQIISNKNSISVLLDKSKKYEIIEIIDDDK